MKRNVELIFDLNDEDQIRFDTLNSDCFELNEGDLSLYFVWTIWRKNDYSENYELQFDGTEGDSLFAEISQICNVLARRLKEVEYESYFNRDFTKIGAVEWRIEEEYEWKKEESEWKIEALEEKNMNRIYQFTIFSENKGYRFSVTQDNISLLGEYLKYCYDYVVDKCKKIDDNSLQEDIYD